MYRSSISLLFFLFIFLEATSFCEAQCIPVNPSGLYVNDVTACSATLHWKSIPNIGYYKVRFKTAVGAWSTPVKIGTDTLFTFAGLNATTKYSLSVESFCSPTSKSSWSTTKVTTTSCSVPVVDGITTINDSTVSISWAGCPSSFNKIRYRLASTTTWITISTGTLQSATITGFKANIDYVFQVRACQTNSSWSAIDTFSIAADVRPNILMIVLDDARWNSFTPTGGPAFYNSTNISRIADEGVNFKDYDVVFSYCTPARASMMTGLYPHKHGAFNNADSVPWSIPNIGSILHNAGYRSGMMGKFWGTSTPIPGFDYWLRAQAGYFPKYQYFNNPQTPIPGHNTNVLTDSALKFISSDVGQPFFLFLGYYAPHEPFTPQTQYVNRYSNDDMPVPNNWRPDSIAYPSFLDQLPKIWYADSVKTDSVLQLYYETLAGADSAIGLLLNRLDSLHILENTMVIFTSDNGRIIGEHGLFMKLLGYDPSIRVPLIIRYPKWYAPGSEIDQKIVLNVDLAPTILDAAGVSSDPYHFDGESLRHIADSSIRNQMLYEAVPTTEGNGSVPDVRAVVSLQYKYIFYGCNDSTEEFFNLTNDPEENTNLIHDAGYAALINTYRNRLITLRVKFSDTLTLTEASCYLVNPEFQKLLQQPEAQSILPNDEFMISPNPAADHFSISSYIRNNSRSQEFQIFDLSGRLLKDEIFNDTSPHIKKDFTVDPSWEDGLYVVKWIHDGKFSTQKLCVNRARDYHHDED